VDILVEQNIVPGIKVDKVSHCKLHLTFLAALYIS